MELKKLLKWNNKASVVYAVGVWTMIGSYFYFRYTGKYDDLKVQKPKAEDEERENPNQVVYETAHSKTVITYKKDFVPYGTRFMNFINSFSGGAGPEDNSK